MDRRDSRWGSGGCGLENPLFLFIVTFGVRLIPGMRGKGSSVVKREGKRQTEDVGNGTVEWADDPGTPGRKESGDIWPPHRTVAGLISAADH